MALDFSSANTTDFIGYESVAVNPGSNFIYLTIGLCIACNLALPWLVRLGRRRRRKLDENENAASDPSWQGDRPTFQFPTKIPRQGSAIGSVPSADFNSDWDDKSIASIESSTTSTLSQIVGSVLDARGKMKRNRRNRHHPHTPSAGAGTYPAPTPYATDFVQGDQDSHSVSSKSMMSALDEGEVDVDDAVDAGTSEVQHLDVHNEDNPGLYEKVLEVADWDANTSSIFRLFLPYSLQGLVEGVFGLIDLALVGYYIGVQAANVSIVMDLLWEFTDTLTYGFTDAVGVLAPQATGAEKSLLVGRYLQLSIIFYTIFSIPSIIIWGFYTYDVVLWFGFDEETAEFAQVYAYPYLAGYIFAGLDSSIYELLEVVGHETYATVVDIFDCVSNTLIILLMVTVGTKDLIHIAYIQVSWGIIFSIANFGLIVYMGWLDPYWEGLTKSFALKDRKAVHTMMVTAIPLSLAYILTYGEWEVLTLFVRFMGPAEVAAWGILGDLWGTFEYLVSALCSAAEVRVGFQMGAGLPITAKTIAYKSVYLGTALAVFVTAILFMLAENLPSWLTPDPVLQRMIFDTLPLVGFGQISMSVGTVCWGIIEAQGRVRLATIVEIVTSWFMVLPLSAFFVYRMNYNLVGLVSALVIGYTIGCVWISYLLFTADWSHFSKIVMETHGRKALPYSDQAWNQLPISIKRAASVIGYTEDMWDSKRRTTVMASRSWDQLNLDERMAAKHLGYDKGLWEGESIVDQKFNEDSSNDATCLNYDDCYWNELPTDVQSAAAVLGYSKRIWDESKPTSSDDKYWDELTSEEQAAAQKLGYTEATWNDGSCS